MPTPPAAGARRRLAPVLVLALAALLGGCGQKGPLSLPDAPASAPAR